MNQNKFHKYSYDILKEYIMNNIIYNKLLKIGLIYTQFCSKKNVYISRELAYKHTKNNNTHTNAHTHTHTRTLTHTYTPRHIQPWHNS